jgi:serine/threonine-protein kinase RsbW
MSIPSRPDQVQVAEGEAERLAEKLGFSDDERDSLAIAVTEIVANAIFHGNKSDPSKKVHLKFILSDDTLTICVRDEGGGFKVEQVADPLEPQNLLKESGRGIFIVKTLMDDIRFHFTMQGTEVILIKKHKA